MHKTRKPEKIFSESLQVDQFLCYFYSIYGAFTTLSCKNVASNPLQKPLHSCSKHSIEQDIMAKRKKKPHTKLPCLPELNAFKQATLLILDNFYYIFLFLAVFCAFGIRQAF